MKETQTQKEKVFQWPKLRLTVPALGIGGSIYCPGCHYGIITTLLCETVEEMGLGDTVIGVSDIGCTSGLGLTLDFDFVAGLHGRALAMATGIKRAQPEAVVIAEQGDGGLGAIGLGHFMSACIRGEKITTILLNNAVFGQTGGQMAPTTLVGMKTSTSRQGRDPRTTGFPFHAVETAASMKGVAYASRVSVHTPAERQKAKKSLKIAVQKQIDGVGFSLIEFLSACPSNWGLNPVQATEFVGENMIAEFPLGEFKNVDSIEY